LPLCGKKRGRGIFLRLCRKEKRKKRKITKSVGSGLAQVGDKAVFASAVQFSPPPLAPSRLLTSHRFFVPFVACFGFNFIRFGSFYL